jgi:predicted amidohydrolase
MEATQKKLTVVLCQFDSILCKKKENIEKADRLLKKLGPEDAIDIVVFPEMAFTGYNFKN